ncbi:MAG TPA: 3-oxoacyl-[acyl-carrier-protein] reductase [Terriglobia bacterium]|nr:3-oxoacyl-[acyl-carrier-protein] reductase [Terriglobia bacterium]
MLLEDKVAFVTGGAQGIGRACALALAQAGAHVVVGDYNPVKLPDVVKEIEAFGRRGWSVQLNVTDGAQVKAAFESLIGQFGRLDILVNNAGITRDGLILRMKQEEWDLVLQTNLTGVFLCTQEAIKIMLKQRSGRIINIASVVGLMGNAGQANYAASKAGVIGLTKTVAQEVASRNITVNAVAPGFIDTAMTQALPEAARTRLLERVPLNRMGTDQDVANAVKFLASDEAGYITGQVLNVNGGMYM